MLDNKEIKILRKGKSTVCLFLLLICFFVFIFFTNAIKNTVYGVSVPFISIKPENLVFCKYKVFGTEQSFKKNRSEYIENEIEFFKSKNEFIIVKIKGEYNVLYKADYILISENSVPDLNVEIYIAKNFDIKNNSLPLKTVLIFMQKTLTTVFYFLFLILCSLFLYRIFRYIALKNRRKEFELYSLAEKFFK